MGTQNRILEKIIRDNEIFCIYIAFLSLSHRGLNMRVYDAYDGCISYASVHFNNFLLKEKPLEISFVFFYL